MKNCIFAKNNILLMKYSLFFLCIIIFLACNKTEDPKPSSPAPSSPSMNTMESSLVGKWYLDKVTDSVHWISSTPEKTGNDYGSFGNSSYVEFKNIAYANGATGEELELYTTVGIRSKPVNGSYIGDEGKTWWYVDSTSSKLRISNVEYIVELVNTNKLIIKYDTGETAGTNVKRYWRHYHFHK